MWQRHTDFPSRKEGSNRSIIDWRKWLKQVRNGTKRGSSLPDIHIMPGRQILPTYLYLIPFETQADKALITDRALITDSGVSCLCRYAPHSQVCWNTWRQQLAFWLAISHKDLVYLQWLTLVPTLKSLTWSAAICYFCMHISATGWDKHL